MRTLAILTLGLTLAAAPAHAEEREYCPDRPGLGTPACTMAPGRVSVELGLADWTGDGDAEQRRDTFTLGETLLRYGFADHAEVQLGWGGLGFARERDRSSGAIDHRRGGGDLTLALRRNLTHPDGDGLAIAAMPFVTLPVGRSPLGDGDWSAGVQVPASYELSPVWSLGTTSEIDVAADEDGKGRHLAFAEVVGASARLSSSITATAEYEVIVDREPGNRHLEHLSAVSLGWQPGNDVQFDVGANLGLNHAADDMEVYLGVSRRF